MESEIKKSSNGLLQEWEGTVTVQNVMKRSSPISAKNGYWIWKLGDTSVCWGVGGRHFMVGCCHCKVMN